MSSGPNTSKRSAYWSTAVVRHDLNRIAHVFYSRIMFISSVCASSSILLSLISNFSLCKRTASSPATWTRSSGRQSFQSCSAASTALRHRILPDSPCSTSEDSLQICCAFQYVSFFYQVVLTTYHLSSRQSLACLVKKTMHAPWRSGRSPTPSSRQGSFSAWGCHSR